MTIEYKDSKRISILSPQTLSQSSGGTDGSTVFYVTSSNERHFVGQEFNTGHTLIDETINSVTFYMKHNAPNSVYKLVHLDSSDGKTDLEDVDLSYSGFVSNGALVPVTFNSFTPFILSAGDKIGIWADGVTGGNSGNWIKIEEASNVDSNAERYVLENSPVDGASGTSNPDLKYTIGYGIAKPTNVQDNSILVEKDTGKRYWFDEAGDPKGTSGTGGDWAETSFNNSTIANNMSASGNVVTRTSGTGWNAYIRSNESISPSTGGGEIYFTQSTSDNCSVGLEKSPFNDAPSAVYTGKDYSFHTTYASNNIYEHTSDYAGSDWANATNEFRITMDSAGLVKYYFRSGNSGDWTLDRTSTVTASGDYYMTVSNSNSTPDVTCYIKGKPATWTYPPTYETDFSSSTGWTTSNSSKVDIDTSANELQIKENGGSLAQMYYDLGSNVSATKWVLRCRILVNGSASSDEVLFKFELNDTSNASANTNSDALGFYVYTDRNNTWSRIYQVCKDSTTSVQGTPASPAYYGNISNSTYYYITLTRSSATDFEVKIRTGSHSGTVLGTLTQSSIPSGLTGLRYITAQTYPQGQGQTMDISDLEFYNGVTSI